NYKDLTQGVMRHKKGYIGEISYDENRFRGEVVSLASKLKNPILEETSVLCRVKRFMDSRCNVQPGSQTLDGYDVTRVGTVSAVDSTDAGRVLTIPAADDIPDGYYNYGRLTVTSPLSPNKDVERKIRKHTGAVI